MPSYLKGNAQPEDIDDYIDTWHAKTQTNEIYEFLGMSRQEYSLWVQDPDALPLIALSRREQRPLEDILQSTLLEMPIAARSADVAKVKRLKKWLENKGIPIS